MGRKHRTADVLPVFIFIVAGGKKWRQAVNVGIQSSPPGKRLRLVQQQQS